MSSESSNQLPEFHLVVRRPSQRGPIAPFRFAASVLVAIVVAFGGIRASIATGVVDDAVLLRAIGAALFTWIVLTVLNRILSQGQAAARTPLTPTRIHSAEPS